MSCNFYFKQWKFILTRLESLIRTDLVYQLEGAHDQLLPDAVLRVTSVMVKYMKIYNEVMECAQNNLQVQKMDSMNQIIKAVASRILELKSDLEHLESSPFHFISSGLIVNKQNYDPEMTTVPKIKRAKIVVEAMETAFERAKEKIEAPEEEVCEVEEEEEMDNVEDMFIKLEEMRKAILSNLKDEAEDGFDEDKEKEKDIPEEERIKINYVNLIKANEKVRQLTRSLQHKKFKREAWEKELLGTAAPPARYELRQKAAKLIQMVIRAYFEIKRKRIKENKRDVLLGLIFSKKPIMEKRIKVEEPTKNEELYEKYEMECISHKEKISEQYMRRKGDDVTDDFRDRIMYWFYEWFEAIRYIHDIPKDGSIAIFREEVPDPHEWLQEYEALMNQAKVDRQELKYQKQLAKQQARVEKQEKKKQEKAQAALIKKMMKFPAMHPGYNFKQSKKTKHLLEILNMYHEKWDSYDSQETSNVKRRFIDEINVQDAFMSVQLEILDKVDADMTVEYQKLSTALAKDYKHNDKAMPKETRKGKAKKKQKKEKPFPSEKIIDKLENLTLHGFVVEYPQTELKDYIGDPNLTGDDYRRMIKQTFPDSYEVRSRWWERCYEVSHGSQKILLVGPDETNKTTLVHALASMNDALLFELDPVRWPKELLTNPQLMHLTKDILTCTKAVEPSVIHIRNVQKFYYTREPPEEKELQLGLIKRLVLQKIFKKINKHDKITIIGNCSDPWLARSKELVKALPILVLLPNVTYSLTEILLKNWVNRYPTIPSDFNVSSLAYVLQKYSHEYLNKVLEEFMTHERLIRIAVYGLNPMEVYNYILENGPTEITDYGKYIKWYFEKTPLGKKEKEHFESQVTFKEALEKLKEKEEKEKKSNRSGMSSAVSSRSAL